MTRRSLLQAGSLGLLGLNLQGLFTGRALAGLASSQVTGAGPNTAAASGANAGFGKAKSCILLFMWGGPSQLDTFDLKPEAPDEVRGTFKPISTPVAGLQVCEHFERVAKLADKIAFIRSLTHDDPAHLSSAHYTLTGHLAPVIKSDAAPPSDHDTPHLGSVVAHMRASGGDLPGFVTLPWLTSHPAAPGGQAPGQTGGWLGRGNDPMVMAGDPNHPNWKIDALSLSDGVDAERFLHRTELWRQLDSQVRQMDLAAAGEFDNMQQKALSLLSGTTARAAFDLEQESAETRDRYGRHIHGQSVLLARRLVEHGVPLVSINWHNDGQNFWDTHGSNFKRLKRDLIPPSDQALSALLTDLDQRGLLDETIVAWVGEFGRRPQITRNNAGREHWPYCYSGLLAGGGVTGGAIYGSSDRHGAYPATLPVTPGDYAATLFHALGIDVAGTLNDRTGRPHRICEGTPISALFG